MNIQQDKDILNGTQITFYFLYSGNRSIKDHVMEEISLDIASHMNASSYSMRGGKEIQDPKYLFELFSNVDPDKFALIYVGDEETTSFCLMASPLKEPFVKELENWEGNTALLAKKLIYSGEIE
ncbi:MAG: hypothetical protein RR213_07425, partial [Raoultibacter sp.]